MRKRIARTGRTYTTHVPQFYFDFFCRVDHRRPGREHGPGIGLWQARGRRQVGQALFMPTWRLIRGGGASPLVPSGPFSRAAGQRSRRSGPVRSGPFERPRKGPATHLHGRGMHARVGKKWEWCPIKSTSFFHSSYDARHKTFGIFPRVAYSTAPSVLKTEEGQS